VAPPREGYAVARDGSPIYYRVLGSTETSRSDVGAPKATGGAPSTTPIILSDGIGCDGYVWKYLERSLADDGRLVIHWHYRGHGRTPEPRDRRRVAMADLADDLASVLDAVGVERAVLAGHSMGVQVCLEAFRRSADRVAGLVLMCGAYGNPLRTFRNQRTLEAALPWISFAVNRAPRLIGSVWRNLIPTRLAYALAARVEINGDLVRLEDFMPYLEHIARVDLPLFIDMLAHAGRHSAKEILPTIDVPALIVAGDRDNMTPRSLSEEMQQLISGSELLVVEGGSHTAPIERPQQVNDRVAQFLAERVDAAPSRLVEEQRRRELLDGLRADPGHTP
jgi:pimeloyl-ACP methyl ester carboxylesterase